MDLSQLSDSDLQAMASGDMTKLSDEGLAHLSNQGQSATPSFAKSTAGGVTQGVTYGYTPQIVGGIAHGIGTLRDMINPIKDPRTGATIPSVPYIQARDATSDELDAEKAAHPGGYYPGMVVGGAASALAAGGAAAPAKTLIGAVGRGAATGAAIGAAANPGDDRGVVHNPLEGDVQAGPRALNAGIGGVLGGAFGAGGRLLNKGEQVSQDVANIKNGKMANQAADAIDAAGKSITDKQVTPKANALRALLQGKSASAYVKDLQGVDPVVDRYLRMRQVSDLPGAMTGDAQTDLNAILARGQKVEDSANPMLGSSQPQPQAAVDMPANSMNAVKRRLASAADYAKSTPFEAGSAVRQEAAGSAADVARKAVAATDPGVEPMNESMSKAIRLRDALTSREGTSPIETLTAKPGTSRGSLVDLSDEANGTSDLRDLGNRISLAKALQPDPASINPLAGMGKAAIRGAANASAAANRAIPNGASPAMINALLPDKNR